MWWRANDVFVGVITGAFAAIIASALELFFVAEGVLSLGHAGGGFGSKILVIGLTGALVGGIVGFFLGALVKPRVQTP
jgi:hypothetical protein